MLEQRLHSRLLTGNELTNPDGQRIQPYVKGIINKLESTSEAYIILKEILKRELHIFNFRHTQKHMQL